MLCLSSPTGVTWLKPFITSEAGGKSGRLVVVGLLAELGGVDGLVGGFDCADTHAGIPQSSNNAAKIFLFAMCFIVYVSQQIVAVRFDF
ncbi:MAG: hypothetical protein VX346_04800 [Planctomycetota bacterium]|nr:hypothetical protein [Planctomycetota bacterium]